MVDPSSERLAELKAFDETRRGVKGLVDTRISRIPPKFSYTQLAHLSLPRQLPKPVVALAFRLLIEMGLKRA